MTGEPGGEPLDRATADELAELPEHNPNPVLRLDLHGTVSLANASARALFAPGATLGRRWYELCPSMGDDEWRRVLSGERLTIEASVAEARMRFTFVRSIKADVVFVYGSDVTDFRRAEQQLSEHAAQLREIARFPDMNPGPVLRVGMDGTILLANAAARNVFGGELTGQSWWRVCPCVDPESWQRVLASDAPVPLEGRVAGRDYVFAHRYDPLTSLVFVFGSDVSALRKAERALRQSEKLATLGTLAAGVAHELNNPAAAARRSADQLREAFARAEETHRELWTTPMPRAAGEALAAIDRDMRQSAADPGHLDAVTRMDRQAALEDWLDARGLTDADDAAAALVGLDLDRKRLDEFAAAVGLDRLPAALAWLASRQDVYALVHTIAEASARVSAIVGALKDYSYMDRAPIQTINLHEGIDNTLVILQHKLKAGVAIERDYDPAPPPLVANGGELNQVWTNLIDNAVDAMGGRGRILIRTRHTDSAVTVVIEDNGPGVPVEIQERVFDPFFTTKPPGKGTGLGLATCYTIVKEKHGGQIVLTSTPGATRFTVTLPIRR